MPAKKFAAGAIAFFDSIRSSLVGFCGLRVSSGASAFLACWGAVSSFAFSTVRNQLLEINPASRSRWGSAVCDRDDGSNLTLSLIGAAATDCDVC